MSLSFVHFRRAHLLLLGGLAGFFLMGCDLFQNEDPDRGEPISYDPVEKAGGLHVRKAQTRVFRDSASWIQFWNEHVSAFDENHDLISPPSVDFHRREIVAVFWGCFYGGCRRSVNAIEGIYDTGDQIKVNIGSLPDLGACRMVQLPLQVASIPDSEKPIEFTGKIPEQRYAVEKCSPPIQCPPWECGHESNLNKNRLSINGTGSARKPVFANFKNDRSRQITH